MPTGALTAVLASIYKPGSRFLNNLELLLLWLGNFFSNLINLELILNILILHMQELNLRNFKQFTINHMENK